MQERKIIQQSRSFKDLDRTLKKLIKNKKAKLAGSIFEYLTKLFLEVSPEYKTKLRKVYLFNKIPTAVKRKLKLPNTDEGIDLIAETFDNEYWAIQCKYRSDKTETSQKDIQPQPVKIEETRFGRNDIIKITNGKDTKELKFKKAKSFIESGEWKIL